MIQIGKYTPAQNGRDAIIQREFYGQGYIVKDEVAYVAHPDQVCYVPELNDTPYTHYDLLELCDGQEELARICFDCIDWQSPSTWLNDQFAADEWTICESCGRMYDCYNNTICPHCGKGEICMNDCKRCFLRSADEHLDAYAEKRVEEVLLVTEHEPHSGHAATVDELWDKLTTLCAGREDMLEQLDKVQNEQRLAAFDANMACLKQGFLDGLALDQRAKKKP